jgi:hypothetical protein
MKLNKRETMTALKSYLFAPLETNGDKPVKLDEIYFLQNYTKAE